MENNIQLPKKVMRNLIASEEFKNTDNILNCLKDMFKQVLEEVMEVELEDKFGYD